MVILRLLFCCLALSGLLFSEQEPIPNDPFHFEESKEPASEKSFMSEFFYMLLMLAFLVGSLYFLSWFLKRMMQTRLDQVNVSSNIKVVERRALSNRTTVYLLEFEEHSFLIAESPTAIVNLTPITENKPLQG